MSSTLVTQENRTAYRGRTVGEIAAQQGRDPWDALCDIAVADELLTSFGTIAPAESNEDWKARLEVCRDPRAVIGASGGGAHLPGLLAGLATPPAAAGLAGAPASDHPSLEEAVHLDDRRR